MKKHNRLQFFKSKSFYVVLFVAAIAVGTVTVVGLKLSPEKDKKQNLVDLNTPIEVTQNEETAIGEDSNGAVNNANAASTTDTKDEVANLTNDELLEYDVESFTDEDKTQVAEKNSAEATDNTETTQNPTTETAEKAEETEQSVSVMQPKVTSDSLSFNKESVISWPVKGNVILPFSMDRLVHYATLGDWKTNPAILISSDAGTDVKAAAKGVVSSVTYKEQTGTTVTVNVGEGYEIVYGQLTDVTCDIGDVVAQGTVIGKVADPTKYFSVEGSNLYFQVLCNQQPVNPMLFLAGEE